MANKEKELLELKDKVEEAKTTVSELTGQLTAITEQFKEDWGCKTVEEASEKLQTMERNKAAIDKKLKIAINKLEEKYEL